MVRTWKRFVLAGLAFGVALGAWFVSPAVAEPVRHDGQKIIRVDVKTEEQLRTLEKSGVQMLDCIPAVAPMHAVVTAEQIAELQRLGLSTQVLVEDVQPLVDAQRRAVPRADPFDDFYLDYHPYGDPTTVGSIRWYMNELVTRYPTMASIVNVGATLEGRTIWGLRITNDLITDKPGVVYFGAEHSREWITPPSVTYFANWLLENYGADATATDLVDHVEFFLVPVFNVDGYLYNWSTYRFWRKNRRNNGDGSYGVDINRNWGEGWGGEPGSSGNPSDETYRGTAPFSEPETQVLRDFFINHPNVRAQLDVHSFSQLILWPWGYKPDLPPDNDVYEDVGYTMQSLIYQVHGVTYAAGPIYTGIYPVTGGSVDWTYAARNILSFSFELRPADGGLEGFDPPPDQILPNAEEVLPAIIHMTNSDWVRAMIRYRFPDGLPSTISAGSDTTIAVDIIGQMEAVVPGSSRFYYRYDPAGSFVETPLTWLGDESYQAVLPATNCLSTPEFYFGAEGDGGTTVMSPKEAPTEGVYTAAVITPGGVTFYSMSLDTNPGWATQGEWAWGHPTGGGGEYGNHDPTNGHTGVNVYGYNLSGDYPNSLPERHLTSTPIDCTGRAGVHLSFWRWLGVEEPAWDHAYVRVSNDGTNWVTIWSNAQTITDSAWTRQEFDISGVADNQPTVYLRWTMGTTDTAWRFCGWNIDDIALSAAVCDGILGDYNGDGEVDAIDFDEFEPCYSGTGQAFGPGCAVFDFNADNDVDCDDWAAFEAAWTGGGDPPTFDICEAFTAPTPDAVAKNRFISFTPGSSMGTPQAFRVTTVENVLFPEAEGVQKWVGSPNANGISRLRCEPTYRVWGFTPVHVGDRDIVPEATYTIEATLNGTDFLAPVAIVTVPRWGDVVGFFENGAWKPPDGAVNITSDAVALVDGFKHLPTAPSFTWCETDPVVPDGSIDILDIVRVVDAFKGLTYPHGPPIPCP